MEEVLLKKKSTLAWTIFGAICTVLFLTTFYLVLYAPIFANNPSLIPLRKSFYEKVLDKVLLPEHLPYTAYVKEVTTGDGGEIDYVYAMVGRFEKINPKNKQLILRDMMGGWWSFDYTNQEYKGVEGELYRKMMVSEVKMGRDSKEIYETKYYLYNIDNLAETEPYLRPGDIMVILWKDKRTLSEIMTDNKDLDVKPIPLMVIERGERSLVPIYKIIKAE